jgi:acetyltransferase-like isoleucine patch superfamily enzyme
MTAPLVAALRALRWRWWVFKTSARLRRLGGRLVLEANGTPRVLGALHVDVDGHAGTLTLRIGRDVIIGRDCVIDLAPGAGGTIELGDRVALQSRIRLQPWGGAIRVGAGAQIRDACELKSRGELRLGARAICGRTVTLHCHTAITLGDCVGLAERVTIADSDHANDGSDTFFMEQPVLAEPVVLERNVFCGTNAVVLRGSWIGCNSVVAAGAVVTGGEHPPGWLIAGVPATPIKRLPAAPAHDPPVPL